MLAAAEQLRRTLGIPAAVGPGERASISLRLPGQPRTNFYLHIGTLPDAGIRRSSSANVHVSLPSIGHDPARHHGRRNITSTHSFTQCAHARTHEYNTRSNTLSCLDLLHGCVQGHKRWELMRQQRGRSAHHLMTGTSTAATASNQKTGLTVMRQNQQISRPLSDIRQTSRRTGSRARTGIRWMRMLLQWAMSVESLEDTPEAERTLHKHTLLHNLLGR